MIDAQAIAQEREQLFADVYDGKIPKRIPIGAFITQEFAIQYAGKDLYEYSWRTDKLYDVYEKICQDFAIDTYPLDNQRWANFYKILQAKSWVMSNSGFLQHPEVEGLHVEDYDDYIASPFDCLVEKVAPRIYPALDTEPNTKAMVMAKAFKAQSDAFGQFFASAAKLTEKYGYSRLSTVTGFCEAPLDFLADYLRGFKGISMDIRRDPDKVEAAVEATIPLMIKWGTPAAPSKYHHTFIPLHMAPYMREKDFARLYWPSFKKVVDTLAAMGQPALLFAEHDWMRYIDYLAELPENTRIRFEYGDPKLIKEKIGKKHIISGLYPVALLKTGTQQECIDKAKELIDILAPGGKFIFDFDKNLLTVDSMNVDNLKAVLNYVASGNY